MKKMALDFGDVRIGIATSDILGILASGLETYVRRGLENDLLYISGLIEKLGVDTVVIGLPLNMDGTEGVRAQITKQFGDALLERTQAKIVYEDERLSSVTAENILIEGNMSRQKRKNVIDKLAATIILQGYLDRAK